MKRGVILVSVRQDLMVEYRPAFRLNCETGQHAHGAHTHPLSRKLFIGLQCLIEGPLGIFIVLKLKVAIGIPLQRMIFGSSSLDTFAYGVFKRSFISDFV